MNDNAIEPSGDDVTGNAAANSNQSGEATPQDKSRLNWEAYAPKSTVLSLQDLIDLPRQLLPEPTYRHLRNAGVEAWLAVSSFVNHLSDTLNSSRQDESGNKARKHINVE